LDYIILEDFEITRLQEKVNNHIQKGYQPVGGVATAAQKDGFIEYIQGMIKSND